MDNKDQTREQLLTKLEKPNQRIADMEKIEAECKLAEAEVEKLHKDAEERVKELRCLYGIDEIITLPGITLPEVFDETMRLIQSSWQYPEITEVRIMYNEKVYETKGFCRTNWLIQSDINIGVNISGLIEVCYLEKKPDLFQGPFAEEEIFLLQRVSNSLEKFIIRQNANNELIRSKEKAEESDKLKSSFLSNMSHEIRTPLNAIAGFGDLLGNDDVSNEEKKEFVPIIRDNINQLLQIIDDILDLSKIESDQLKIFKKDCRIDKVMEYMSEVFNNRKTQMGREIDIRVKAGKEIEGLTIFTDTVRLQQVLSNLIGNALKFTESGYAEIGCSMQTGKDESKKKLIQFHVKDTGIGISEKDQKMIFDRFTKIEDDKTKLYRGTGLGLAISKQLVIMLGGEMWVESTPGKGSTFYFTISSGKADLLKHKTASAKPNQDTIKSDNWEGKSILVAEDEHSNFRLIKIFLQRTKINITHVTNGVDAVEALKSNSFDLVLMDIKMPEMNGLMATKKIKNIKKELPVIAVTAYAREEEQEECRQAGCDDIVVKPLTSEKLFTVIRKQFRNTQE